MRPARGRVVNQRFFPLTASKWAAISRSTRCSASARLPAVVSERDADGKIDVLEAYADNYLTQEIRHEALVKNLDAFARFIEVAALVNGQQTNVAGIARDAAIARPTVQGWFDILVDTLVGSWLPAWRPRAKVKETAHPKFYFFDPGAVRALAGRLREPVGAEERGHLLETFVLHELRAWLNRSAIGGQLSYWRTPSGSEVDFVWHRAATAVGIEVKAAPRWRAENGAVLRALIQEGRLKRGFGVYLGREALRDGRIDVLPLGLFLKRLAAGDVLV